MPVSVITDSAAALPAEVAERAGIAVVPLRLVIGGRSFRDGELDPREVLARAAKGVTTSGPSAGEVLEAIRAHASENGTLVLTVAAAMSSTYQAARAAAARFPGPVRVLDTATAAGAQGLAALAAAERARAGGSLQQVEAVARAVVAPGPAGGLPGQPGVGGPQRPGPRGGRLGRAGCRPAVPAGVPRRPGPSAATGVR